MRHPIPSQQQCRFSATLQANKGCAWAPSGMAGRVSRRLTSASRPQSCRLGTRIVRHRPPTCTPHPNLQHSSSLGCRNVIAPISRSSSNSHCNLTYTFSYPFKRYDDRVSGAVDKRSRIPTRNIDTLSRPDARTLSRPASATEQAANMFRAAAPGPYDEAVGMSSPNDPGWNVAHRTVATIHLY